MDPGQLKLNFCYLSYNKTYLTKVATFKLVLPILKKKDESGYFMCGVNQFEENLKMRL